jgi:hypothetical protein
VSRSTGPILAVGAITMANAVIFHDQAFDWRVPIATGLAAGMFALAERAWEPGAVGVAWVALVTTLFVPLDQRVPPPVVTAEQWWGNGAGRATTGRVFNT